MILESLFNRNAFADPFSNGNVDHKININHLHSPIFLVLESSLHCVEIQERRFFLFLCHYRRSDKLERIGLVRAFAVCGLARGTKGESGGRRRHTVFWRRREVVQMNVE
jgi:hypothetical protein